MANDEPQQQESQPPEQRLGSQLSQHVRPKIQRKSPNTKTKKQNTVNHSDIAATVVEVEVEETRKRMESWMGLGSNNNKYTSNKQKAEETKGGVNDSVIKNENKLIFSHEREKPKELEKNMPVSILKSPKYSSTSQVVAIDAVEASSALASTKNISVGGDVPVGASPSKVQLQIAQPQHQNTRVVDNFNDVMNDAKKSGNINKNKFAFICKDIVIERDPTIAATKRKTFRQTNNKKVQDNTMHNPSYTSAAHYASIEGYVPSSSRMEAPMKLNRGVENIEKDRASQNSIGESDEDPLVIDSLEGLMKAAGEKLPEHPNKITNDTKMVEANISFSVMTQDQYEKKLPAMKEEHEEERNRQLDVFMGKLDIFGDDDNDESIEGAVDGDAIDNDNDDDDDDDAVMELLLGSDFDADDENNDISTDTQPEVRAFTLLWDALTNWMTHDTVIWVKTLRDSHQVKGGGTDATAMLENNSNSKSIDTEWTPMVDRSDIGASRCAGVLAMIRLYLGKCMEELNHPLQSRRKAEKRLSDIMRTFDYSLDNPKLTAGHWRAMTCILLDAVLIETREADSALIQIPPSVAKIGMRKEEFEYLSRKAVLIFE